MGWRVHFGPKAAVIQASFNYLIGTAELREGAGDAQCLGDLEFDDQVSSVNWRITLCQSALRRWCGFYS
jgi:hypothetical protein